MTTAVLYPKNVQRITISLEQSDLQPQKKSTQSIFAPFQLYIRILKWVSTNTPDYLTKFSFSLDGYLQKETKFSEKIMNHLSNLIISSQLNMCSKC